MNPSTALAAALAALTEALSDPDVDLESQLDQLADEAGTAVASYLGLTVTATVGPVPTALIIPPAPWRSTPQASLQLVFPALVTGTEQASGDAAPVVITLYASTPGAFIDLAADFAYMFAIPLADIAVDRHLPELAQPMSPPTPAGALTPSDVSVVNQAIGVLIGQGHPPHHAHATLARAAANAGITLTTAATLILTVARE